MFPSRPSPSIYIIFIYSLLFIRNLLACKDTGDCKREGCNDTLAAAPTECHDHVDEMNCFRVCQDPAELLNCFNEHAANNSEEYCVLKYSRALIDVHDAEESPVVGMPAVISGQKLSYHPGIPCSIKCRVDPVFWSCVHSCDTRGCFKSFNECESFLTNKTIRNPITNKTRTITVIACNTSDPSFLKQPECADCYVNKILHEVEEHPDCIVRYSTVGSNLPVQGDDASAILAKISQLPQCTYISGISLGRDNVTNDTAAFEDINFCVKDVQRLPRPATSDDVAKCYKSKLMRRQVELCQRVTYTIQCKRDKFDTRECLDRCLIALTKPFCYVPCPRNLKLAECKYDCSIKWPTVRCSPCYNSSAALSRFVMNPATRLNEYKKRIQSCGDVEYGCYAYAIHNETRPQENFETVKEWEPDTVRVRNCKSKRHISVFSQKLVAAKRTEGSFDSDVDSFADHFTFRECYLTDCRTRSETDAQHCMRDCVVTPRTAEEMDFVCNPHSPINESFHPLASLLAEKHNFFRAEIVLWCMWNSDKSKVWNFVEYMRATLDFSSYESLYFCEKALRESGNFTFLKGTSVEFETFAKITYELEMQWCQSCMDSSTHENVYHPDDLNHSKCELDKCYKDKLPYTCQQLKSLRAIVRSQRSTQCYWSMDYSISSQPYKIWSTYFDEIPPRDETHELNHPYTLKYLSLSSIGSSSSFYVFPYFLVIRPLCEDGYYDDNVYKFISSGGSPVVQIKYYPHTSREKYIDLLQVSLQGALVNLERRTEADKRYIPANPLNRPDPSNTESFDGHTGCHLNLCYPAFLVPQVLLHIPIFKVIVSNSQTINAATTYGYSTTLHLRDESGDGTIKIADKTDPPTADEFFPVRKVQVYEDTQFVHLWGRLPDSDYDGGEGPPGPELEHMENENCVKYHDGKPLVGGNPFHPLDGEDFFQLQYTHGNAPQAIMAGFYDPNLVIIGDPDMRRFELVRWQFEVTSGTKGRPSPQLFHPGYPCFSHHFKVRGFVKPMYSLYDRLDPDYWLEFYRMRFIPKDYQRVNISKAIFSAITMEDRVLFVTTSGIVTFYQNFNNTAGLGKAWEVEAGDRLKKCFKIVRVARRAHPKGDTIVAITYDYQVSENKKLENGTTYKELTDISQQVWVGTYLGKAEPIKWQEITSGLTSENLKEERVFNVGSDKVGYTEDLPNQKLMGIPVERRETSPKSQIEAICYKTYRSNMGKAKYIELIEDQGWCDAVDATPVTAVDQKIQVLVRMKAYYSGGTKNFGGKPKPRNVVLYVVASLNTDKSASQASIWQINSIIPRVPCQDEHRESIPSVVQYSQSYFRRGSPDVIKGEYGCHSEEENQKEENLIYLHGMTYTRSYNHHLFLYGNKLLQSTDGGETFVQLNSFPERGTGDDYNCAGSNLVYHRIKVMAFDDLGHYAFLTSKRELWYGNLGSLTQIRLRPSSAHSMVSVRLPEVHELAEAVPFTVFFDSSDELVEMVAVVDANGTVSRIGRRSINEKTILRAKHFLKHIAEDGDARFEKLSLQANKIKAGAIDLNPILSDDYIKEIKHSPLKWSTFCPFASPSFHHNFSARYGRTQKFYFPAPKIHHLLGSTHTRTSLFTFQAIAFNLIWSSFFNVPYRTYSFDETDQFIIWSKSKSDAAVLGKLTFLNDDPLEHGILVTPEKYRRYKLSEDDPNRIFQIYYMDYGIVIKLIIEYSISNDYTLNPIDYLNHHLESILLNVDNANGSLIQINTEKEILASRAAVRYVIIFSVRKYTGLPQSHSGRDGIQVPIKLHLIGGFGNCIETESGGVYGDSIATVIQVGCPPSTDLVFDWYSTLHSIQFRDEKAHYGNADNECYNGEVFCFFARYPLIPHFHIFDTARQQHYNFTGRYIMRIIGGGYSRDSMITYTKEEQQAFNVPGVSDVSLIWNEWDKEFHQKVQRSHDYVTTSGRNDSRELVLQAGVSAIQWGCHTLSPCARISPRIGLETVYYFKVFISNRGVDNDTLCLFEKEFAILLYGFPPSPEIQLITSVAFYMFIMTVFYIAYFCLRGHKKVWRSTTLKLYGWFQVIKDTLPKSLFKFSEEEKSETEQEAQRRKDEIVLSLQGHLNVPRLIPKRIKTNAVTVKKDTSKTTLDIPPTSQPSVVSFQSGSSDDTSSKYIIDPLSTRPDATTWTDLIYEQIISRRLAAILERSRERAAEAAKIKSQET